MTGPLRRLLLWAGHNRHCRARMMGLADEVRAVQKWAVQVEQDAAARLADVDRQLRSAHEAGAAQERRNRDALLDRATTEAADMRLEAQILRTQLEGGDRSELLRERETNRVLEQRNAALREQNEALTAELKFRT
ncbi:hypothetical protein [Streptosporangium sp. NPDC048865]|uniref:hypothetical protein n=1 Tax=Streptosporangium sp. NPDC048865 TaxID=3155766 RepID=UPI0034469763